MRVAVDDVELDVLDEGRGAPLVLLHGFPLAKETWDPVARLLRGRARIVRIDLRGLGRSSVPPGPYLMERLAADLAGVLDRLSIERAIVAGHSLGAMVAWAFLRGYRERVSALGIVCGRSDAADDAEAATREALAGAAESEGIAPIVEAFLPRYFTPSFAQAHPEIVARTRETIEACDPRGAAAMLRGMARRISPEDLLAEIRIPVAFVAGTEDVLLSAEAVRATAEAVAGATFTLLECGHFPLYEAPESLTAVLGALISRTPL
jgi:pimeloyl-ACP methyl ester carboxylesterase